MKKNVAEVLRQLVNGLLAGIMISLGGAVFLSCNAIAEPYGKFVGAVFFPMALLCICWKGYGLYTGKIGLIYESHKKRDVSVLLVSLLGNAMATFAFGYLIAYAIPQIKEAAFAVCSAKLDQGYLSAFLRAILCGILVFMAVDIYRNHKTVLGIVFCIPVFILSGYEHSIADMFYFAASGIASWQAFLYLWIIIAGNSVGGLLIPTLKLIGRSKEGAEPAATDTRPADAEEAVRADRIAEEAEQIAAADAAQTVKE